MREVVKFLDRKILVVILVAVMAMFGVRMIVLSGARDGLEKAKADRETAAKELEQIEQRVEQIRAQGSENLQDVIGKVAAVEQQLPPAPDELTLTVAFDNLASASGVELSDFTASEGVVANTTEGGGILTGHGYNFTIQGNYSAAVDFLERVLAAPTFLATFDSLELRPSGESSGDSDDPVSLFQTSVRVTGIVLLWSLEDTPSVAGAGSADDLTVESTVPSSSTP